MNNISPENKMKEIIFDNLDKNKFKAFLFGSRAMGNYKKNSDYDIGIIGEKRLSFQELMKIKNKLRELPYLIDLVDFNAVDNDFKEIALNKIIKWN
ncbi:MAG: nucleotidyltransferase domain-containing protein [Candidatus Gracilibacteria bacterium]|nr:nucleotidyltransferase domain-containing protein [Candidatus Gracilibacteria bacterium]MDQ7022190.1 nucleotidyltransferase domain-containing protein [Candidatus Gracilibacteria bacterium]